MAEIKNVSETIEISFSQEEVDALANLLNVSYYELPKVLQDYVFPVVFSVSKL